MNHYVERASWPSNPEHRSLSNVQVIQRLRYSCSIPTFQENYNLISMEINILQHSPMTSQDSR